MRRSIRSSTLRLGELDRDSGFLRLKRTRRSKPPKISDSTASIIWRLSMDDRPDREERQVAGD